MPDMKPNFFIVGAPKCGTSAWVHYLSGHPDVFFSPSKEPHYFCTDFPGFRWVRDESRYLALFEAAGTARLRGEASVHYLYSERAAENIRAFNESSRILILLRRQGSFLPSYHNQLLYNRDESDRDFARVWRASRQGVPRPVPRSCREPSFLDYPAVGDFETQVQRYLDAFPPEQVRVAWMEDWRHDTGRLYEALVRFLGLEPHPRADFQPLHTARHHRSQLVATLTNNPPAWVLNAAGGVKRLLGLQRLGIAPRIRHLNRVEGYPAPISPELVAEIDELYRLSNARLNRRIAELGVRLP